MSETGSPTSTPGSDATADDEPDDMFIDEVHEYLKCAICLCVLKNPFQVCANADRCVVAMMNAVPFPQTPCGHRFCLKCITPVIKSRNNVCPNDRTEITFNNTFPDNAVRLQINNLRIKCPNSDCGWQGTYSDKAEHLGKCPHSSTTCNLCGVTILKAHLLDHQKEECPNAKVINRLHT